jgi:hypothetical protein
MNFLEFPEGPSSSLSSSTEVLLEVRERPEFIEERGLLGLEVGEVCEVCGECGECGECGAGSPSSLLLLLLLLLLLVVVVVVLVVPPSKENVFDSCIDFSAGPPPKCGLRMGDMRGLRRFVWSSRRGEEAVEFGVPGEASLEIC